ncbi:MAG: hypothetical protein AAGD10_08580 [Myxococcota bacterium]
MSYQTYRFLHLLGMILLFLSLGGVIIQAKLGGKSGRAMLVAGHGTGLLVVLVAGFGMLAKGGELGLPGWVIAKLVVWLVLGGITVAIKRKAEAAGMWYTTVVGLGLVAVVMGVYKPL